MEFPDKSGAPKKDLKPVVTGAVQVQRPATRRFKDFVFAESPRALGAKIGRDIVVPRLKASFEEAVNSFLSGMLWGGGPRPLSNMVSGTVLRGGNTNVYHAASQGSPVLQAAQASQVGNVGQYSDVVCPTQGQAETLLANMIDVFNEYRVVSVGDLFEMANLPTKGWENSFGWYSLDGARISKVREGYVLELPRPSRI